MNRISFWEVVEKVPSDRAFSGVFTKVNDANGYPFLAHHCTPTGASTSQHKTREEAEAALEENRASHRKFWEEKVAIHLAGDKMPNGMVAIRIDGKHFMAKPREGEPGSNFHGNSLGRGFGGRLFRWRDLLSGKEYWSNDMWHQGDIPAEFRDRLPDNAVWLENTSAVR